MVALARRATERVESLIYDKERQTSRLLNTSLSGNAIAGVAGGFVSSLVMHPLDVVITRMQAHDGRVSHIPKYRSTFFALGTIIKTEGIKTLYIGIVPNIVGSMSSWGIYFLGYNYLRTTTRTYLNRHRKDEEAQVDLGPLSNLGCAVGTGLVAAVLTQPIWLVKTRLQLQLASRVRYTGMIHCFQEVVRHEGVKALFRGLVPSLLLVSHVALHFVAYEELKLRFRRLNGGQEHLSAKQTCVAASIAKLFATVVTYPTQVVRTRLQQMDPGLLMHAEAHRIAAAAAAAAATPGKVGVGVGGMGGAAAAAAAAGEAAAGKAFVQPPARPYYGGASDVINKIIKHEGVGGFYKGLGTNVLRVIPTTAITFVVYEAVAKALGAHT